MSYPRTLEVWCAKCKYAPTGVVQLFDHAVVLEEELNAANTRIEELEFATEKHEQDAQMRNTMWFDEELWMEYKK